jgi:hypothetical protein
MTKRTAAMWAMRVRSASLAATLVALGVLAACGKTGTTESGETHFITCAADTDCKGVSGARGCDGGYCRNENGDKIASSNQSLATPACGACDADSCAAPGTCSLASACKTVDCGSALVDDQACIRPSCTADTDCPDDERCTFDWWSKKYNCVQQGSSCKCDAGHGLFPMNVCSPTSLVGPRGAWQKLVITETVIGMATERTFTPDGGVTVHGPDDQGNVTTSTKQLSTEDLDQLTQYLNGSQLRPALAVDPQCPITKELDVVVQLVLDTTTLEQNVAGCLNENAPAQFGIFQSVVELSRKY